MPRLNLSSADNRTSSSRSNPPPIIATTRPSSLDAVSQLSYEGEESLAELPLPDVPLAELPLPDVPAIEKSAGKGIHTLPNLDSKMDHKLIAGIKKLLPGDRVSAWAKRKTSSRYGKPSLHRGVVIEPLNENQKLTVWWVKTIDHDITTKISMSTINEIVPAEEPVCNAFEETKMKAMIESRDISTDCDTDPLNQQDDGTVVPSTQFDSSIVDETQQHEAGDEMGYVASQAATNDLGQDVDMKSPILLTQADTIDKASNSNNESIASNTDDVTTGESIISAMVKTVYSRLEASASEVSPDISINGMLYELMNPAEGQDRSSEQIQVLERQIEDLLLQVEDSSKQKLRGNDKRRKCCLWGDGNHEFI